MVAQREKLFRLLSANPEIRRIVARALEVEENDTISRYCYGEWPTYAVNRANRSTRSMVNPELYTRIKGIAPRAP